METISFLIVCIVISSKFPPLGFTMTVSRSFGLVVVVVASLGLVACSLAPKSNEVSAIYVPMSQYSKLSCDELVVEAEAVRRLVPALASAVDSHRGQQTGVESVTWLLFWPAAFALDKGEAQSSQLAKAKGEMEAIALAMRVKKCGI